MDEEINKEAKESPNPDSSKDQIAIEEEEAEEEQEKEQQQTNSDDNNLKIDQLTQTDNSIFEKPAEESVTKTEENFSERNFYPQLEANGQKIDHQIEKINEAIEKLQNLTNNFYKEDDNDTKSNTSLSPSAEKLSVSLHLTSLSHPKKKSKKRNPQSAPVTPSKISKKATGKKPPHKRFLSPLRMTTEARIHMSRKGNRKNGKNSDLQSELPKGTSPLDPIVLKEGYPIVFDYEPKDLIRQERVPHCPVKNLYKNGDIKYDFADGTVRINTPNNFVHTFFTNGDKQYEFPDHSVAYKYNSNNCVEFSLFDKSVVMLFFENGQIEEHFANGKIRVRFADGSQIKIFPDKSFICKDEKGSVVRNGVLADDFQVDKKSLNEQPEPIGDMLNQKLLNL